MFVRFQAPEPDTRGRHVGVFVLANRLAREGRLSTEEYAIWRASNDWYDAAYPDPTTTDRTIYDPERHLLAAAWFKDTATLLLDRVPVYLDLLASHGIPCVRVESTDPGRVVYEDSEQIVVVPHDSDASTSRSPAKKIDVQR